MNKNDEIKLIELTKELISIPSITGMEATSKIMKYVNDWLKAEGIESEVIHCFGVPNLIARIGKKGKRRLLWNGHLDVVATGDYMNWDYPPFSPVEKEGYLYGRGSSDAKSSVASMMMALKLLKTDEDALDGEITLMVVGEAENGSAHGTIELLDKYGAGFDAAVVGEATDLCIEIAEKGLRWLELRIHGAASHAGRPHLGINAISQAGKIIKALDEFPFEGYNELFEEELRRPSVSVNKIHGGIQNNVLAENCKMVLDRRMLPGETEDKVLEEIISIVNRVVDEKCQVEYSFVNQGWDPFILDGKEPIVQNMKEAYVSVMGKEPVFRGKATGTDAAHIYKRGIPVIIMGPGNPNVTHRNNEKVRISNIVNMVNILIQGAYKFFMQ